MIGEGDDDYGSIRYELPVYFRGLLDDVPGVLVGVDPFDGTVASPFAVLRERALVGNIAAMQDWCRRHGAELAPHGKTTMAPDIFARQLTAGAWGLTAASPAQARVALAAGARRVLIANQVTDVAGIRWLGATLARDYDLGLWCYVDSVDGVALLDRGLRGQLPVGTRLNVLLEVGVDGGRTGVRDEETAIRVARAVTESSWLRLSGVAGYEGVAASRAAKGAESCAVIDFCRRMHAVAVDLVQAGLVQPEPDRPLLVTAGGSAYFDDVAAVLVDDDSLTGVPKTVVLRSGAYVTHDEGLYARTTAVARGGDGPELTPAFEVWGRVLSRPEPTRAVVDVGRRDAPYDQDLPAPRWRKPAAGGPSSDLQGVGAHLNDQHCFIDLPADEPLAVGEWVGFAISHPCTAFDKWNLVLLLDDSGHVIQELPTRF
ncbi:MAG: amino acid deaminase [Streptosporangiales bacterium]|nr:amino acid deaminase [Streptosporangiales bacterium]